MEIIKVPFITYIALVNIFQSHVQVDSFPLYLLMSDHNTSSTLLTLFQ